jgi:hypothetical protein
LDPSHLPERNDPPLTLSSVGGTERRGGLWLAGAALLVALAVVKPWAALGPPRASDGPTQSAVVASVGTLGEGAAADVAGLPTQPAAPQPADALHCLQPDGWRLVTYEQLPTQIERSWIVVTPATAAGPLDPAILVTTLVSSDMLGLGLCAPASGLGSGPWRLVAPRITAIWHLTQAAGSSLLKTVPLDPLVSTATPSGTASSGAAPDAYDGRTDPNVGGRLAILYGPPQPSDLLPAGASLGPAAAWPAGRYVLSIALPGSGIPLWLGLDLQAGQPILLPADGTTVAGAAPTSPSPRGPSATPPRP